jgi:6-phosphogluconate dehydrogenase
MADHGYRVAVYNRTTTLMEKFVASHHMFAVGLGPVARP